MNTKTLILSIVLSGTILGINACGEEVDTPIEQQSDTSISDPSIDRINARLQENPNDASLYAARAGVYYEKEGYDQAIKDLEKAISLDSSQIEFYHVLADIYLDYYKSRLALNVLEDATRRFPGNVKTLLKQSEFQLILRQHQGALITTNEIQKIDPLNAEMFFMRGLIRLDMGDTTQAINNLQAAVENDPDIISAWVNLGELYSAKDIALAERFYDNALSRDPNNIEALHAKAFYLSNYKNDLQGSLDLYRQIVAVDAQYEDAYYNSGLLYLDMDSTAQANAQFEIAIQVNPNFTSAYFYRGVSYEIMGQYEAAKNDYQQTLNLEPNFARAQMALDALNQ